MDKIDFSKLGFDQYQSVDLHIMMNLKSASDIQEWMNAVGDEDVQYGIDLMLTACEMQMLDQIDKVVDTMPEFIEAKLIINKVK